LPYSLLSLLLLLAILFTTVRPPPPRFHIVFDTATIFLLSLTSATLLGRLTTFTTAQILVLSAISIVPVIYLLDYHLRHNTQGIPAPVGEKKGRRISSIYRALLSTALAMLLIALLLDIPSLLTASIMVVLYLLGVLIWLLSAIPPIPLDFTSSLQRVIAGTNIDISVNITSKASNRIHCLISPMETWTRVAIPQFILGKGTAKLNFSCTPPLSGPTFPRLQASVTDTRGFIELSQSLEPVELHVIPRARYVNWIARKYLEQVGRGVVASSALQPRDIVNTLRGIEYHDSRSYQPGDQLKDIDWKHTLKLSQLIISEFVESGETPVVIVVNLSVTGAEEADKLAFNLVASALTLARENIPTALAAYNHERAILTMAVSEPREILKRTLSLIRDIDLLEHTPHYLEAQDIVKLRRNITHLRRANTEPARHLLDMLHFEHRAIEGAAQNHPATSALASVTKQVPAPAMILLISQLNHDTEALLVNTERLSRSNYTTMALQATL